MCCALNSMYTRSILLETATLYLDLLTVMTAILFVRPKM